jgi:hypothetical protein
MSNRRRQIARVMKIRNRQDCPCTVDEMMRETVPFARKKGQRRSVYELWWSKHHWAWSRVKVHQLIRRGAMRPRSEAIERYW